MRSDDSRESDRILDVRDLCPPPPQREARRLGRLVVVIGLPPPPPQLGYRGGSRAMQLARTTVGQYPRTELRMVVTKVVYSPPSG